MLLSFEERERNIFHYTDIEIEKQCCKHTATKHTVCIRTPLVDTGCPLVHLTFSLILSLLSSTLQSTHMPLLQKKQVCWSRFHTFLSQYWWPPHPFTSFSSSPSCLLIYSLEVLAPLAMFHSRRQSSHVGSSEKVWVLFFQTHSGNICWESMLILTTVMLFVSDAAAHA